MFAISSYNITSNNNYLRIALNYPDKFCNIIFAREFHIWINNHGIFIPLFFRITQANIITGIISSIFRAGNKYTSYFLTKRLNFILIQRIVINNN